MEDKHPKSYEQVIMQVKSKTASSTILEIGRKKIEQVDEKMHVAGGQHTGIVINKGAAIGNDSTEPPHLTLEFRVFLVSAQTGKHTQESRILRFWFRAAPDTTDGHPSEDKQATVAQEFFKELVSPKDFPRDYVGFIKKIMKAMQHNYMTIKTIELELRQQEDAATPVRPLSAEEPIDNIKLLTVEKVLDLIESAYPNPITIQDVAKEHGWDEEEVAHHLAELQSRNLVKNLDHGAFTRQQSHDAQVTIVKQMPTMASSKQPTIAIITAQYCEKLAVDAMIENKETFVRYTTVGESNVYTLGNIGAHRIVCTKLPSVGHTREAMTAAGNTTTRLLGTFQKVDYVFLVGAGGGVPHYTDYNKHVRLGDVVVSYPKKDDKNIYFYCERAVQNEDKCDFELKSYRPHNLNLQDIAANLKKSADNDSKLSPPWVNYIRDALNILMSSPEPDFRPPNSETDKLYMNIGNKDLIEVAHPLPLDKSVKRQEGCPRIHLGGVASGRQIVKDDILRQKFAAQMGVLSYDSEFDAVIESILGNCKDSFICIRGISDYKDGTRQKEWQPYASLAAASVMKAVICSMEAPTNV